MLRKLRARMADALEGIAERVRPTEPVSSTPRELRLDRYAHLIALQSAAGRNEGAFILDCEEA